jgi:hypothetical protein
VACSSLLLGSLAVGCDSTTTPGKGVETEDAGHMFEPDSGSRGHDGGGPDAQQPDRDDASVEADAAPLEPPPEAQWDASVTDGPPEGMAYTEVKGSFVLEEPAALKLAFGTFTADTGDARLFLNDVRAGDDGPQLYYGGAFVEDTGAYFQYPKKVKSFAIAPSVDDAQTFVSKPFDYELFAWVPSANDPEVGYELQLGSTLAVWVATFDADFEHISKGSLTAVVLRSEAEVAPFDLDFLSCLAVCKKSIACSSGVTTLADFLDCNDAKLNVDADGNGANDGYRLRFSFRSERVTLAP